MVASVDVITRYEARFQADGILPPNGIVNSVFGYDFGRAVNMARWGFGGRFCDYRTAESVVLRAGELCRQHYTSWADFSAGYALGRVIRFDNETVRAHVRVGARAAQPADDRPDQSVVAHPVRSRVRAVGRLIVIEGLDGAGKRTLATSLEAALGGRVARLAFPRYGESVHADLVREGLHGRLGGFGDEVYGMAMLYALDRHGAAPAIRAALSSPTSSCWTATWPPTRRSARPGCTRTRGASSSTGCARWRSTGWACRCRTPTCCCASRWRWRPPARRTAPERRPAATGHVRVRRGPAVPSGGGLRRPGQGRLAGPVACGGRNVHFGLQRTSRPHC